MNASTTNSPLDELRAKLAEVRSQASKLEEEITLLEKRGQLELPSAPAVQKIPHSPAEKVALFLDLFGATCTWTRRSLTRYSARARRRTKTSARCRSGRKSSSS